MPELLNIGNDAVTTITEDMTSSTDRVKVADLDVLPDVPFRITIDAEIMEVGEKYAPESELRDITRGVGVEGTAETTHANGSYVFNYITAGYLNQFKEHIESSYSYVETIYFTSSGNFEKGDYPWLKAVKVKLVGGGGSGGGVEATSSEQRAEGAGGGGAGYSEKFIKVGDLNDDETVVVGEGGAPANPAEDGNNGETSSFGAHLQATGGLSGTRGLAGAGSTQHNGGNGGTGSDGDFNLPGSEGGNGRRILGWPVCANFGGSSHLGAIAVSTAVVSTSGRPGRNYGSGSSGARVSTSQAALGSTAGADGIVIVELYA